MKEGFEYIRCYWNDTDEENPVVLFYEVDLENERYATRLIEVFADRKAVPVIEEGFEFVTEQPVPNIEEINREDQFFAEIISKEEFEKVYSSREYQGDIRFRHNE